MKIIHLNTFGLSGGAGIAAGRLVSSLNAQRPGSASILSAYAPPDSPAFTTGLEKSKTLFRSAADLLRSRFYGLKKANDFLFSSAHFGQDLTAHPLVLSADIIHIHWINQGFLSLNDMASLGRLGKPVVITMHDMWLMTGGCHYSGACRHYEQTCGNCFMLTRPSPADLSASNWEVKQRMLRSLNPMIVTCSNWLGKEALKSNLLSQLRIATVPNPINTAVFTPGNKQAVKAALGFAPDEWVITLSAFKLTDPRKGFSYFTAALNLLLKNPLFNTRKIRLVLIGTIAPGHLPELPFPVTCTGYLSAASDIIRYGQASDLFVLPSLEDNLPNTVMEMMAMGVPVIAFNAGGVPDLIDHKLNGYLAFFRSAESLAKGILWVLNDLAQSTRLRRAARMKVIRSFDMKIVADQYLEIYEGLLSVNKKANRN